MHTELASPVAGHCRKIGSRTHVAGNHREDKYFSMVTIPAKLPRRHASKEWPAEWAA